MLHTQQETRPVCHTFRYHCQPHRHLLSCLASRRAEPLHTTSPILGPSSSLPCLLPLLVCFITVLPTTLPSVKILDQCLRSHTMWGMGSCTAQQLWGSRWSHAGPALSSRRSPGRQPYGPMENWGTVSPALSYPVAGLLCTNHWSKTDHKSSGERCAYVLSRHGGPRASEKTPYVFWMQRSAAGKGTDLRIILRYCSLPVSALLVLECSLSFLQASRCMLPIQPIQGKRTHVMFYHTHRAPQ